MKIFKSLILLLFISSYACSQTIINAERFGGGADSSIYALSISYNGTRGNSSTDQLNISPTVILLRKNNEYKVFGGYALLSQSGTNILNGGFVHLRHNYKINNRLKTFEFYQLQFNEVLLLKKREVFGAGLRFSFVDKDSLKSNFGMGLMRELEVLNNATLLAGESDKTINYRATSVYSFKIIFNKLVKLDNVFYYQPWLKDFTDYRMLNDFIVSFSITNHFDLMATLTTRYDSKPPGNLGKLDNAISFGFNIKF